MQKLMYLSNSRDYTEQKNINENQYFVQVNKMLAQGWKVVNMTHDVLEGRIEQNMRFQESYVSFVLLEKPDEDGK